MPLSLSDIDDEGDGAGINQKQIVTHRLTSLTSY